MKKMLLAIEKKKPGSAYKLINISSAVVRALIYAVILYLLYKFYMFMVNEAAEIEPLSVIHKGIFTLQFAASLIPILMTILVAYVILICIFLDLTLGKALHINIPTFLDLNVSDEQRRKILSFDKQFVNIKEYISKSKISRILMISSIFLLIVVVFISQIGLEFWIYNYDSNSSNVNLIVIIIWTVLFTLLYIQLAIHSANYPKAKFLLYGFLFAIFLLALLFNYSELINLAQYYAPSSNPAFNRIYQIELKEYLLRYSRLMIDWSLLQSVIFSIFEFSGFYDRLASKRITNLENLSEEGAATIDYCEAWDKVLSLEKTDHHSFMLFATMLYLHNNENYRTIIKSISNAKIKIKELPSYVSISTYESFSKSESDKVLYYCKLLRDNYNIFKDENSIDEFDAFIIDTQYQNNFIDYYGIDKFALKKCTNCEKLEIIDCYSCLCKECSTKTIETLIEFREKSKWVRKSP